MTNLKLNRKKSLDFENFFHIPEAELIEEEEWNKKKKIDRKRRKIVLC